MRAAVIHHGCFPNLGNFAATRSWPNLDSSRLRGRSVADDDDGGTFEHLHQSEHNQPNAVFGVAMLLRECLGGLSPLGECAQDCAICGERDVDVSPGFDDIA